MQIAQAPRYYDEQPPPDDESEYRRVSSWQPADLAAILDGSYTPAVPTIGERSDGRGLFYPGRAHALYGESEGGKSWVAQLVATQELARGHNVVYLDFEDDAASVVNRLLRLGVADRDLAPDRFAYISPHEPLTTPGSRELLAQAVGDLRPTFIALDGVTEALSMHGLSTVDNDDLAKFGRMLIRPLTDSGAAVLSLDHVVKSTENRNRYAIGGVHKLNGLSGAAYILENIHRFGDGMAGLSRLLISKDRPGQLRPHALPGSGDRYWYADFTLDTRIDVEPAELRAPIALPDDFRPRPTILMGRVSDALAAATGPLSSNDVVVRVTGKAQHVRTALAHLVDDGNVTLETGPRGARLHKLTTPFDPDQATP